VSGSTIFGADDMAAAITALDDALASRGL